MVATKLSKYETAGVESQLPRPRELTYQEDAVTARTGYGLMKDRLLRSSMSMENHFNQEDFPPPKADVTSNLG